VTTASGQHQHCPSCQRSGHPASLGALRYCAIHWRLAQTIAVDWRTPLPAQRHPLVSALSGSYWQHWPLRSRAIDAQRALAAPEGRRHPNRSGLPSGPAPFDGVPRCGRASLRGICGHRLAAAARRCAERVHSSSSRAAQPLPRLGLERRAEHRCCFAPSRARG
jgi:hypothetical protein